MYASQKALKEKGIDEMLDEARESNRENDAQHMKRACKSLTTISISRIRN